MKRQSWLVGGGFFFVILFCSFSNAFAVTINYDGTGNGINAYEQIGSYYAGLDSNPVHSSGFQWLDYGGSISDTYGPHSINAMAFSISTNPVWVTWSSPVDQVSFWYGYYYPLSVYAYNGDSLVYSSGALAQNSNGMFQYSLPSNLSITRLEFNGDADYWTMDDLSYNGGEQNPTIPEPITMVLFSSGLFGAFGFKRKIL